MSRIIGNGVDACVVSEPPTTTWAIRWVSEVVGPRYLVQISLHGTPEVFCDWSKRALARRFESAKAAREYRNLVKQLSWRKNARIVRFTPRPARRLAALLPVSATRLCVFRSATGPDRITNEHVSRPAFEVDAKTVSHSSAKGKRPYVGTVVAASWRGEDGYVTVALDSGHDHQAQHVYAIEVRSGGTWRIEWLAEDTDTADRMSRSLVATRKYDSVRVARFVRALEST